MSKKMPLIPTFNNGVAKFAMGAPPPTSVSVKVKAEFYKTKEWRDLINAIDKERGRSCQAVGCPNPRAPGTRYHDHIVELKDGGAPLDRRNIAVICPSCHRRKTLKEAKRRAAPSGSIL